MLIRHILTRALLLADPRGTYDNLDLPGLARAAADAANVHPEIKLIALDVLSSPSRYL
jgi:hypothetical protein